MRNQLKQITVAALICVFVLFSSGVCLALLDDNSTNNKAEVKNVASSSRSSSYSDSDSSSISGSQSESKSVGEVSTTVRGDDTEVTSVDWPATPSTENKEERSIYSLFGGIGNNTTEEHIKIQHQMQIAETLLKSGTLSEEEYASELKSLYTQLAKANRPGRFLGVFNFNNRGCSVFNACGLLVIK